MRNLQLFLLFARRRIRAQLEYPASFAIEVVTTLAFSFLDFAGILVLFHNVQRISTWSVSEVAFLYATSALSFSLTEMCLGSLDELPELIRSGNLDLLLARPVSVLLSVVTENFFLRRIGRSLQATGVLVYAIATLSIHWTFAKVVCLLAMLVCGAVIFGAAWIAASCVLFWSVDGRETMNVLTTGASTLAEYPIGVYGRWLRMLFAYAIPVAFVTYFPSLYILDKPDALGLPPVLRFLAPVAATLAVVVAGLLWRAGLRRYTSAGG